MAITLNGTTNTISGLAVGGLPDGVVDEDTLADGSVTFTGSTVIATADINGCLLYTSPSPRDRG